MSSRIRADFVALLALLSMVITGILTPVEALSGFSNNVVILVAGLFIVGAGLLRTGLAQMAWRYVIALVGKERDKIIFLFAPYCRHCRWFMSNTGTVALMLVIPLFSRFDCIDNAVLLSVHNS